ncbi:MAG TPA: lysine decarboxylase, partial [Blastocatellia bacterium]|nr:lysine decarboxylase [Blastocatellia bacterium]
MDPSKVDNLPPVAYLNADFLKSPEARLLRILSEYIEPAQRLRRHRVRDTIVFFGSARSVAPDVAEQRLQTVKQAIDEAGETTPALALDLAQAEASLRLSRFYQD